MIKLSPISRKEYEKFTEISIIDYANEKVKAGNWNESEALEKSRAEFKRQLPNGEETEGHFIFSIVKDNQNIGYIWLYQNKEDNQKGFIYDFLILEEFQGKGYGKETMHALEVFAKSIGINKIGLHVFGHNVIAYSLYKKMGYKATNINMEKHI